MNLLNMSLWSDCLTEFMPVSAIMPDIKEDRPARVLYLLHGLSDDNTIWHRLTGIERYAGAVDNLCVIMPTTHRAWYTNTDYGARYWDYIADELPRKLRSMLNISAKRDEHFAAGISMGGYGALKLGLLRPENYRAVFPVSGAFSNEILSCCSSEMFRSPRKPEDDVYFLIDNADLNRDYPKIEMFCGASDFCLKSNNEVAALLETKGFDYHLTVDEGNHQWDYWDTVIRTVCGRIGNIK